LVGYLFFFFFGCSELFEGAFDSYVIHLSDSVGGGFFGLNRVED